MKAGKPVLDEVEKNKFDVSELDFSHQLVKSDISPQWSIGL